MSRPWITVTSNGARYWVADDREHALEQHEDAFGNDPSEKVIYACDVALGEAAPDLLEAAEAALELVSLARNYFPKSVQNSDRFRLENINAAIGAAIAKAKEGQA